jgi:PAS domain S-box-containing protein
LFANGAQLTELRAQLMRESSVAGFEFQARRRDGSLVWLSLDAGVSRDDRGRVTHFEGFARDVSLAKETAFELQRARRAAEESAAGVHSLLDNAPVFLAIVRLSDGVILECNPRCELLFHCTAASLVGRTVHQLYYAEGLDRERFLGVLTRDGRVRDLEIEFQRSDGSRFPALVSAEYLTYGGERALVISVQDISSLRAESASAASDVRLAFLTRTGYELRTPLNAIIGYSELLAEELDEAPRAQLEADISKVRAAGIQMRDTLDTMIALAGFDREAAPERERLDVERMLAELGALARPIFQERANRLDIQVDAGEQPWYGDMSRVRQVLMTLLLNAGRRTSSGFVRLAARRRGEWQIFELVDNGEPLDEDLLQMLARPLDVARELGTLDPAGPSLGLRVSRRICDAMGGDLLAGNLPDGGARFMVRLPAPQQVGGAEEVAALPREEESS